MTNDWIPITEKLPEKGEAEYLVTTRFHDGADYRTAILDWGKVSSDPGFGKNYEFYKDRIYDGYAFGVQFSDGIDNLEEVIAWMPLPEPYKGE